MCVCISVYEGKGRGENTWKSPPGSLSFSFKVQLQDGPKLPLLQYLVSLSMVEALQKEHPNSRADFDIRLKWPNDIYTTTKEAISVDETTQTDIPVQTKYGVKLGGILCQSSYFRNEFDSCFYFSLWD